MMPIVPEGTRTRWNLRPLGRVHSASTVPTGSANAAISSRPVAIPAMRFSSSIRRSTNAAGRPAAFAASMSLALAARIFGVAARSAFAAATSAAFFSSAVAIASLRLAAFAALPMLRISFGGIVLDSLRFVHRNFLVSAMSSRWISVARPSKPRIAAISLERLPMIRRASSAA